MAITPADTIRECFESMDNVTDDMGVGSRKRGKRECRVGTVVSDKGAKTIKVRYDFTVKHRKYGKYHKRSTTLHTHDENDEAKIGDVVEVVACRRMSKMKFWRLKQVIRSTG